MSDDDGDDVEEDDYNVQQRPYKLAHDLGDQGGHDDGGQGGHG